jgi:KTSC domain
MRVRSSTVYDVTWREGILYVTYNTGTVYKYFPNVPEIIYKTCITSPSVGKYLNKHVKGVFKFEKLDETPFIEAVDNNPFILSFGMSKEQIEEAITLLEKKGLVKRESDEQGNERIIVTGDIAKEVIDRRIIEAILRQHLSTSKIPKSIEEYLKEKK